MAHSLTEWAQASRLTVVEVLKETGLVRVKDASDACTELSCGEGTLVVTDDELGEGLAAIGPGDVIKVDHGPEGARRIVVVRRSWDEIGSPEF
jgi:hypothetical protein